MLNLFHLIIVIIILVELFEYEDSKLHTILSICCCAYLIVYLPDLFDLPGTQLQVGYALLSGATGLAIYNLLHLQTKKRSQPWE